MKENIKTYGDYLREATMLNPKVYNPYLKQYKKASDVCVEFRVPASQEFKEEEKEGREI